MNTKKSRETLRAAIDRCCVARGEAQWTNGYRAGLLSIGGVEHVPEDERLYQKELKLFQVCTKAEEALERHITEFARVVRASQKRAARPTRKQS